MSLPDRALTPTLEAVEDAIVTALNDDETMGAYLKSCSSFQGSVEESLAEGVAIRDPAVLVLFAGGEFEERGPEEVVLVGEWHLVVRAQNLRGEQYRRRPASASEVGSYQLVQDVLRVLTNQDLGLEGLAPLVPMDVELLKTDRRVSAYAVAFRGELDLQTIAPSGDDDTLKTVVTEIEVRNDTDDEWNDGGGDVIDNLDQED